MCVEVCETPGSAHPQADVLTHATLIMAIIAIVASIVAPLSARLVRLRASLPCGARRCRAQSGRALAQHDASQSSVAAGRLADLRARRLPNQRGAPREHETIGRDPREQALLQVAVLPWCLSQCSTSALSRFDHCRPAQSTCFSQFVCGRSIPRCRTHDICTKRDSSCTAEHCAIGRPDGHINLSGDADGQRDQPALQPATPA